MQSFNLVSESRDITVLIFKIVLIDLRGLDLTVNLFYLIYMHTKVRRNSNLKFAAGGLGVFLS